MQVIGVNKDHVGVSVPTSEWEFAMQEVLDKQNRFVFKWRRFSNVEITPEQAVDFTLPDTFPRDRLQQPNLPEISEMPKFDPMQKNDPWKSPPRFPARKHSGWSPQLEMRKRQMEELLTRRREIPVPLEAPVAPASSSSSDDNLALVLAKLTELTVGVNDLRAQQSSAVTRADLQEFHEKASSEHKAYVASQTEPLRDAVSDIQKEQSEHRDRIFKLETLSDRVEQLESRSSGLDLTQLEKIQMKVMNANDPAYQQMAISGFKTGSAEQRINAVKAFITAECGPNVQCTVTNEEKGPRNKRELTETTFITFVDTCTRDKVLKAIEAKYPKCQDQIFGTKIELMGTSLIASRARTKTQKARSWALRKAFELVKHRASSEIPGASIELDWTMPERKVLVNGEPAFIQTKDCLRGSFVGHRFQSLSLPV